MRRFAAAQPVFFPSSPAPAAPHSSTPPDDPASSPSDSISPAARPVSADAANTQLPSPPPADYSQTKARSPARCVPATHSKDSPANTSASSPATAPPSATAPGSPDTPRSSAPHTPPRAASPSPKPSDTNRIPEPSSQTTSLHIPAIAPAHHIPPHSPPPAAAPR